MNKKFVFDHVVDHENREVLIRCNSSITAIGIPTFIDKHYPGYVGKICTDEYLEKLKTQLSN